MKYNAVLYSECFKDLTVDSVMKANFQIIPGSLTTLRLVIEFESCNEAKLAQRVAALHKEKQGKGYCLSERD